MLKLKSADYTSTPVEWVIDRNMNHRSNEKSPLKGEVWGAEEACAETDCRGRGGNARRQKRSTVKEQ